MLDYQIRSGVLDVCIGRDFHLELPRTREFENAALDDDPMERDAEVSATENHG